MRITAKPNNTTRTFTIRTYNGKNLVSKYRTFEMNKEEFNDNLYNTE